MKNLDDCCKKEHCIVSSPALQLPLLTKGPVSSGALQLSGVLVTHSGVWFSRTELGPKNFHLAQTSRTQCSCVRIKFNLFRKSVSCSFLSLVHISVEFKLAYFKGSLYTYCLFSSEGAKKEGAAGFFKGIGKGLVGAVARPTGGIVDMASSAFQGIQR